MNGEERDRHLLLDGVAGWRWKSVENITTVEPDLDLRLESIPGTLDRFLADDLAPLGCPVALDFDDCGKVMLIADRASKRIWSFDPKRKRLSALPIGSPIGDPRGIAVLTSGAIAIIDPSTPALRVFSPFPHALLRVHRDLERPWDIVAGDCNECFVVDRGRHRVQPYGGDGVAGTPFGEDVLEDPTAIARTKSGLIAVADGSRIVFFDRDVLTVEGVIFESLAFDEQDGLFAGTRNGLIFKFVPDGERYRQVGISVTGVEEGAVVFLRYTRDYGLLAIVRIGDETRFYTAIAAGAYVDHGTYLSQTLDSGIERCTWHRVAIDGDIPEGTSIEVWTETSDDRAVLEDPHDDITRQTSHLLGNQTTDCLVLNGPGRFLRLQLRLTSSARGTPRVHALRIELPRQSYLQYLPAVFQEDPDSRVFLSRFLSIFQASFDAIDRRIDNLWQLFDPRAVPAKFLPWLAGWLALPLDAEWSEEKKREVLSRAFREEQRRGTVAGLEQAIRDYAGVRDAHIVEHFTLRKWTRLGEHAQLCAGTRLWSRGVYDRMQLEAWSRIGYFHLSGAPEPGIESAGWGANEFSVFYLADDVYGGEEVRRNVERVVEREKPAHTKANIHPVHSRFRIGVQSTIEVDSVVGGISHLVLGSNATLGSDSILGGAAELRPRAGLNVQLL